METPSQKIMATSSGLMEKYPVSVPMAKGVVNFQSATVREAKYIVAGQRVTVEFMNRVERCQEDGRRKTSKLPDKEYQKVRSFFPFFSFKFCNTSIRFELMVSTPRIRSFLCVSYSSIEK